MSSFWTVAVSQQRRVSQLLSFRNRTRKESHVIFPVEVWEIIIEFFTQIEPSTEAPLSPLLTVHSVFHHSVERVLYRNINLWGDYLHHAPRRVRLFERLAANPRLARLVESFILPPLISRAQKIPPHEVTRYCIELRNALCAMTRLRSLAIIRFSTDQNWTTDASLYKEQFKGCTFRLRVLRLGPFYRLHTALLENQQEWIEDLTTDDASLPTLTFPNLHTLAVTSRVYRTPLLLIGPGRPIRALCWMTLYPRLNVRSLPMIKSLRLSISEGPVISFVMLSRVFPSLSYLRLDFYMKVSNGIARDCNQLYHFPLLRKVVFGGWGPLQWQSFKQRRDLANKMFFNVPSLNSVSLGLEVWERDKGDVVALVQNQDEWRDEVWWN